MNFLQVAWVVFLLLQFFVSGSTFGIYMLIESGLLQLMSSFYDCTEHKNNYCCMAFQKDMQINNQAMHVDWSHFLCFAALTHYLLIWKLDIGSLNMRHFFCCLTTSEENWISQLINYIPYHRSTNASKHLYLLWLVLEVLNSHMQYSAICTFWSCGLQCYFPPTTNIFIASSANHHLWRNWSLRCWLLLQMRATPMKLV